MIFRPLPHRSTVRRPATLTSLLILVLSLSPALRGTAAEPGDTFKLLSYNIHHGEGMDKKTDLPRIAAFIKTHQPDAVALQEVDRLCGRTGKVDQPAELAKLTGMTATFQKAMDYDGGEYGICMLTKNPPLEAKGVPLPPGGEPRTGQWVRLPAPGGTVTVANTHLDVAKGPGRLAQAVALGKALSELAGPVIWAGDFNAVRNDEVMNAVSSSGWSVPEKQGNPFTIPSISPQREIDFAVLRPETSFKILKYTVPDEPLLSDHRPILIEFSLTPNP
ncbi:MAG: metal-dependent hydrolase [Verrucomicrobiales bacterium]|nr:metal-dependent hydrolase [Verrucomicrobiales bacterium]